MTQKISNSIGLLLGIAAVVLFFNLSYWGVTETSEARYAEISWEMYQSGDFLHPTLLNIGHYHKPPVTYWITAVAYNLLGPNVFAARFFLQIAVLLQILLVYKIGIKLFDNKQTAFYAAAIYFSFPAVIIASRALTTDAYLATFILASVYFWIKYRQDAKVWALYLFYFFLGLGFLDKGPVDFIIPIVFVIAFNRLKPPPFSKAIIHHVLGILLLLVVGFSWFLILYAENPAFLDYFIFKHTIDRFASNTFHREKPFWFYFVIVPVTAFPWFFLLIKPLRNYFKEKFSTTHVLLFWVFLPLIFFSMSTSKLILYVLPIYGGMALLSAYQWHQIITKRKVWVYIFLAFCYVAVLALALAPQFDASLVFNTTMYGMLIGMATVFTMTFYWMKKFSIEKLLVYLSIFFTSALTMFATFFFHNNAEKVHDQRHVAAFIRELPNVDEVYVYNKRLPSIAFELQQPIVSIADGDRGLKREVQFEQDDHWKQYLLQAEEVKSLNTKHAVMLMEDDEKPSESIEPILRQFTRKKRIDGWLIYY